jgi:membrane-bound lytic murein transglycosylase B
MVRVRTAAARHRPEHARPSALAPGRATATLIGLAIVGALGVAGCAAAASTGGGGARGHAAAPVRQYVAPLALRAAGSSGSSSAGVGALFAPGSSSAPASSASAPQPPDAAPVSGLAASGIPVTALTAYQNAAALEATRRPACGLTWPLLAGIGRVESDHGRFAGAVLHSDGLSTPRIIGIALDGHGTALIRDTDGGRLDGDTVYDRAVGPMQFIPSTWASWGVDANHDGNKDPFNIFDAAAAAADYLCAAGHTLTTTAGQVQAILSYNHSYDYVSTVMGLEKVYASQVGVTVPVLPTTADRHGRPHKKPGLPPVDPGRPPGAGPPPSTSPGRSGSSSPLRSSSPAGAPTTGSSAPGSGPPSSSTGSTTPTCPTAPGTGTGTPSSGSPSGSPDPSSSAPAFSDPCDSSPPGSPSSSGTSSGPSSSGRSTS